MKKSTFFAIGSSNKKKVRNFIKLAKRMGVDYNEDFTDSNQQDRYLHLGFSNNWNNILESFRCSFTVSPSDALIDIDTADGYIKAVSRLIQEINELKEEPAPIVHKFDDKHGNELFVGNIVVIVDTEDLDDIDLVPGDLLSVVRLIDVLPNYIEFKSMEKGKSYSFYGNRVVKIQYQ